MRQRNDCVLEPTLLPFLAKKQSPHIDPALGCKIPEPCQEPVTLGHEGPDVPGAFFLAHTPSLASVYPLAFLCR